MDELLAHLAGSASGASLTAELSAFGAAADRAGALVDLMGLAASELAPRGDPPIGGPEAEAWQAALAAVAQVGDGGYALLGRPGFLDEAALGRLVRESREQPRTTHSPGHEIAQPGPALRALAVDRRLVEAVSAALGFGVKPGFRAIYMHLSGESRVAPHVDHPDYEVIVHLTLEHEPPASGERAALFVYRLDGPPVRLPLAPGEALTLCGRANVHARDRLGPGESWSSTAIAFEPVRS